MKTPFTTEQFFGVFEKYNIEMFPIQLVVMLTAVLALYIVHYKSKSKNKFIGSYMGILWIWMGLVYHLGFFREINTVANIFGIVFILQGILITLNAFFREKLVFTFKPRIKDYLGYLLIIFGLFIYPAISYFSADSIETTIAVGLPCPSTILTFGFFMLSGSRFPKYLLIIPSLWALIGFTAALKFGVYQDVMLLIAAIIANIILLRRKTADKEKKKIHKNLNSSGNISQQ